MPRGADGDEQPAASPASPPAAPPVLWTPAQRGVVLTFTLVLAAVLAARLAFNRHYISDPPPARPANFDRLADRIDPNVATWQDLAVLPQLGEKRAREIVAFREQYAARERRAVAFERPEDLLKIRGIGVAMLATIQPYLMFPATAPTTTNASATSQPI